VSHGNQSGQKKYEAPAGAKDSQDRISFAAAGAFELFYNFISHASRRGLQFVAP
jgi:hypothetical protein